MSVVLKRAERGVWARAEGCQIEIPTDGIRSEQEMDLTRDFWPVGYVVMSWKKRSGWARVGATAVTSVGDYAGYPRK